MTDPAPPLVARAHSVEDTRHIAAGIASLVEPGDLLLLIGDLGAGKTAFAGGLVHGLGVTEPVPSPTFALAREYHGRVPVAHLDVYRLDHLQEFYDLGIDDYLDGEWVLVVEWGDMVADALPPDRLDVVLTHADPADPTTADRRTIVFEPRGAWRTRRDRLAAALATRTDDR